MYEGWALVTHNGQDRYLFRCPAFRLKKGDGVLVETKYGEQYGEVIAEYDVNTNRQEYEFLTELAKLGGARFPLKKVLGKLDISRCFYEEGEDGTDKD